MSAKYGLDIGTMNVRLSCAGDGNILSSKNVIAIRDRKNIIGYCDDAWDMFEKAPENVDVIFPVESGVVSDIEKMQLILEYMYKEINFGRMPKGSEFLISVPTDTTEVEKRAFHELVAYSKIHPSDISIVEKSVADAVGCGIDIKSASGNIIVNIGAGTTDISVVSLGGIVLCNTIRVGGNDFNEAIISAYKNSSSKLIGMKMAESLKIKLADMEGGAGLRPVTVFARMIETGLPVKSSVEPSVVNDALKPLIDNIVEVIKQTLEKTPPELAADIETNGIYVIGGGANIKNLDKYIERETKLDARIIEDPINCTIRGITDILKYPKLSSLKRYPQEKTYN